MKTQGEIGQRWSRPGAWGGFDFFFKRERVKNLLRADGQERGRWKGKRGEFSREEGGVRGSEPWSWGRRDLSPLSGQAGILKGRCRGSR